ncbi:MAG TPA: hypothetical protein VIO94_04155 [Phenylobacterium sp.]
MDGALICNIGDMLERLTAGRYRSTHPRVMNRSGQDQLSFPLFFDPDFLARMEPLPQIALQPGQVDADRAERWDGAQRPPVGGDVWRLPAGQGVEGVPGVVSSNAPPSSRHSGGDSWYSRYQRSCSLVARSLPSRRQ